jgi:hypothetical protein
LRALQAAAVFIFAIHSSLAQAAALQFGVTPSEGALISLSPASTCLDLQLFAKRGGQPARSAAGPVLSFDNFSLELTAGNIFYIQGILVILKGRGIVGGSFAGPILPGELDALLGTEKGVINGPVRIHSGDKLRKLPFAPCGLVIDGIPLVSDSKTAPFAVNVTVTVFGALKTQDGHVTYITRNIKAKARFLGQK